MVPQVGGCAARTAEGGEQGDELCLGSEGASTASDKGRYVNSPRRTPFNASYRHAKVVAERIANREAEALGNPVKTINTAYAINKGQLEIALDDLGPFEAYALTITLSR
jgi:hypothetical protein